MISKYVEVIPVSLRKIAELNEPKRHELACLVYFSPYKLSWVAVVQSANPSTLTLISSHGSQVSRFKPRASQI